MLFAGMLASRGICTRRDMTTRLKNPRIIAEKHLKTRGCEFKFAILKIKSKLFTGF